jgi:hypothetical protein
MNKNNLFYFNKNENILKLLNYFILNLKFIFIIHEIVNLMNENKF